VTSPRPAAPPDTGRMPSTRGGSQSNPLASPGGAGALGAPTDPTETTAVGHPPPLRKPREFPTPLFHGGQQNAEATSADGASNLGTTDDAGRAKKRKKKVKDKGKGKKPRGSGTTSGPGDTQEPVAEPDAFMSEAGSEEEVYEETTTGAIEVAIGGGGVEPEAEAPWS
jgi:hypothetical protein